jgi:hypothetical protein
MALSEWGSSTLILRMRRIAFADEDAASCHKAQRRLFNKREGVVCSVSMA